MVIILNQEYLKQVFDYEPDTGICVWKERPLSHFKSVKSQKQFNKRRAGKVAGFDNGRGYKSIRFDGKKFYLHRLIMMQMGFDLEGKQVDHINSNRSDNRLENLRVVTHSENLKSQRLRRKNKSGLAGVGFFGNLRKPWRVVTYPVQGGKAVTQFVSTIFEAACIRRKFEIENGYTNHGQTKALKEYANNYAHL